MTLFINIIDAKNKETCLHSIVSDFNGNNRPHNCVEVDHQEFRGVNGSPFSYWVSSKVRGIFSSEKFTALESEGRDVQSGATTGDDFRFLRLKWETPLSTLAFSRDDTFGSKSWVCIPKGGSYSKFYSSWHLVANWNNDGAEIKEAVAKYRGDKGWGYNWSAALNGHSQYFRPGLTWSRRTTSGLSLRTMPSGGIFADKGPAIFCSNDDENELLAILSLTNSRAYAYLVELQLAAADAAARSYEVGIVENTPVPVLSSDDIALLSAMSLEAWRIKLLVDSTDETSSYFDLPLLIKEKDQSINVGLLNKKYGVIQESIDDYCFKLYEFDDKDTKSAINDTSLDLIPTLASKDKVSGLISWAVGVVFGRFSYAEINKASYFNSMLTPFSHLPGTPPGFLKPGATEHFPNNGVLVSNEQSSSDLSHLVERLLTETNICLDIDLSNWIDKEFFKYHLKSYSKSRRQAPVYWPLQTASGSYTVWVYYHKLNQQTLLSCVNDFVEPELQDINNELMSLKSEVSRKMADEKKIDKLTELKMDLEDFRDRLLSLATFWQPNIDDGVQITAAPLWRLFQHKAWQKKLKQTWEKLEEGDYDWAHLAYTTWPERVLKKCHADRSIAIAHDVESDLWHEVEVIKGRKKEPVWEWQPRPLSPAELNDYVREKIATDERLALYRSNAINSGVK